jgi:flavin reductase (DIM6/NTAB) family NADH-FMN oxidoreductase RutF
MMQFSAEELSAQQRYKLAIGSVVPRPIALVSTVNEDGTFNVAPFSFFNIVCINPLILVVSVQRAPQKNGLKDTARNILRTREFSIGVVTEENVNQVNITSGMYPYGDDEFEKSGLTPLNSTRIDAPLVTESPVSFECVLESSQHFGSDLDGSDAFFGKVKTIHCKENLFSDFKIDLRALAPVSRLAGVSYAKVGEIFDMERP